MARLILFLSALFLGIIANAQDTSLQKYIAIQGNFTDFTADNIGNIYLVINNQQLKKLDAKGDSIAVYNDVKRYGNISLVDASNAFKILVFYKATATIVILDRLLSVKNIIELRKSGIQQVRAIRLSYDNNIWLYDEGESKITKIDDNGKLLFQSIDLRNLFTEAPAFESIFDDNKSLYLYDPKQGWFIFDYYAAFIRKHSFLNWKDAQVINGNMMGRVDSSMVFAKQSDLDFKTAGHMLNISGAIKIQFSAHHTYILSAGNLHIYDAP
jgi:hypothetical protein